MDDSADKELADRFKAVFDDHQDAGAAEGWALLQKRQVKKRPVPYYWLSGAAAILLLAFGLGWFIRNTTPGDEKNKIVKTDKAKKRPAVKLGNSERPANREEDLPSANPGLVSKKETPSEESRRLTNNKRFEFAPQGSAVSELLSDLKKAELPDAVSLPSREFTQAVDAHFAGGNPMRYDLLAVNMEKLFGDENPPEKKAEASASSKSDTRSASARRALALSIFAGSQVNYGKENTRRNARPTGGLQAELALGRHFSVGLGAGIADYQLAYNDGLPAVPGAGPAVSQNNAPGVRTSVATGKRNPSFVQNTSVNAPISTPNDITTSFVSYRFVSTSSIELNRVTARFTAVEIPLAFSWKPLTGKTGLSVSAALNSSWMIREAYVADLSIQNFNGTETPVNSQRNEDTFTSFTPFSSVQFSLGLQPGGQRSRLSIEPFARFPLQNQGLEQLRYGAAGLNVKFRLNNAFKN